MATYADKGSKHLDGDDSMITKEAANTRAATPQTRGTAGSGSRKAIANAVPRGRRKSALGTTATKEQQQVTGAEFKAHLWALQRILWDVSAKPRLKGCHRWRASASRAHVVWAGMGSARWAGLQTSGSVWASPLSSAKIIATRQKELETAVSNHIEAGGSVAFLTLTLRHKKGTDLRELWDALSYCWRGITGTASYRGGVRMTGDRERFGIAHFAKAVEVTHSFKNGWHPHLHVLLFLDEKLSDQELQCMNDRFFERWKSAALRKGLGAPTPARGIDLVQVSSVGDGVKRVAGYMAKGNLARSLAGETSGGAFKSGRKTSRTPFQILEDLGTEKSSANLALWREWEEYSEGRRQLTWSAGAKKALGVLDISDDEAEAAAETAGDTHDPVTVAMLVNASWEKICSDVEKRQYVLDAVACAKTPEKARKIAVETLEKMGLHLVEQEKPLGSGGFSRRDCIEVYRTKCSEALSTVPEPFTPPPNAQPRLFMPAEVLERLALKPGHSPDWFR